MAGPARLAAERRAVGRQKVKATRVLAGIFVWACALGANGRPPWLTRWFECERSEVSCNDQIEAEALAASPSHAHRAGKTLTLGTDSAPVVLTDSKAPESSTTIFRLLGELTPLPYFVVHVAHYEGDEFMLVHQSDGSAIRVPAVPVPSPDGRRIAVASGMHADYNPNRLEVWQLAGTKLGREWSFEPREWAARLPEWVNASEFRACKVYFTTEEISDPKCQCEPIVIRLGAEGWNIRDESNCRPTSR